MSAVEFFWRDFADASWVDAGYSAWAFGSDDDPALQAKLGSLVRDGPKRATTGLLSEYEQEGEALPGTGDYSVILDGRGGPLCIIRTTHVELRPFGEVDAEFARVESGLWVVGLREGSILRIEGNEISLQGERDMRVFRGSDAPRELQPTDDLAFLLGDS